LFTFKRVLKILLQQNDDTLFILTTKNTEIKDILMNPQAVKEYINKDQEIINKFTLSSLLLKRLLKYMGENSNLTEIIV
jgi:hypothetical protein